jgi:hypothetical protein|tara:strand:+ start:825 stop:959 length:135 start_codon:yes stop_codon:yes gene_type:complete
MISENHWQFFWIKKNKPRNQFCQETKEFLNMADFNRLEKQILKP